MPAATVLTKSALSSPTVLVLVRFAAAHWLPLILRLKLRFGIVNILFAIESLDQYLRGCKGHSRKHLLR